jgi:gliding motility-associated-like protein
MAYRVRALRADQAAFSWSNILEVGIQGVLSVPNVISANGDGQNDTFFITGIAGLGNVTLEVLNRFGRKVYENDSYQNNWDGGNLPSGVYYYILRSSSFDVTYKGWVHILR